MNSIVCDDETVYVNLFYMVNIRDIEQRYKIITNKDIYSFV